MGVTYHGNYLPWFEMARVALLDQLGTPYRQLEQEGFLLPVLETGLTYHRPSRFDDRVRITVTLAEKPKARLKLTYQVERDGELLVEGFTVHAFVNREFKAVRPPDNVEAAMRQAFGA
jgi:acyl-CoA thioester hydrolase